METIKSPASYFSVSPDLVVVDEPIPYDLFINSSSIENREKYVRIFRKSGVLSRQDVQVFMTKYHRIYVAETERQLFLKSLVRMKDASPVQKTTVLKDSAIHHLQTLFQHEITTEVLGRAITDCRDVVEGMIDVVGDYRVDQLQDLIGNLSFHDFYTYDHSINVSMYCIVVYKALEPRARRGEIVQAGLGGLLHDLGKIRISTEILNSADKLTETQFAEIKRHPVYGRELLEEVKASLPPDIHADLVGRVILEHHENFDGTGYPNRLGGKQIHLLSRVTTIADFFDAITTKRSYHEPLTFDEAIGLMTHSEGKKIDPELFRFFSERIKQMELDKHRGKELSPDFDPCQPCRALPLISLAEAPAHPSSYVAPPQQGNGKIKFVDPRKAYLKEKERKALQKKKAG